MMTAPTPQILISGATGFIGTILCDYLLENTQAHIWLLIRASSPNHARTRLQRQWWDFPHLLENYNSRIHLIPADISSPGLGIDIETHHQLWENISHIIHSAGVWRITAPLSELQRLNIDASANMLKLAKNCCRHGQFQRFSHISTAYVCGQTSANLSEDTLLNRPSFSNAYEQTKYEGERIVREMATEIPMTIFRPGMVVGDSRTGWIKTFNTLYLAFRAYIQKKMRIWPVDPSLPLNFVPVDYVAGTIADITLNPMSVGYTFHLTAPESDTPTVERLFNAVTEWCRNYLDGQWPDITFIGANRLLSNKIIEPLHPFLPHSIQGLTRLIPYFIHQPRFSRDRCEAFTPQWPYSWTEYLPRLLRFGVNHHFLHRSDRTPAEQALHQIERQQATIQYRDMRHRKQLHIPAAQIKSAIRQTLNALLASGFKPGDRLAIIGVNSHRYAILDIACGLAGIITVPLYFTSPLREIQDILAETKPRALAWGIEKVEFDLNQLPTSIPIIFFCTHPPDNMTGINWDEFLKTGQQIPDLPLVEVNPNQIATIRYSSGTTGIAQPVFFTHRQIRWIAETIASFLPCETTRIPMRYLSFLPMNHVVEGIMGLYTPYYLPGRISITFLDQIKDAAYALRKVKPTIFFSVPRLYEKIHHRFYNQTWFRKMATTPALQKIAGSLLQSMTGLNRCQWLITGSAPIDQGLLNDFRSMGIEIHNAYGLTEAPLISINLPGRNHLQTVGERLPQTSITLKIDHEIAVQGPQIGYTLQQLTSILISANEFAEKNRIAKNEASNTTCSAIWENLQSLELPTNKGILHTGDLGELDDDGYLILSGRKKDILITSYGKNINPQPIETRLNIIPGIQCSLLIGDQQPFCGALLWAEPDSDKSSLLHIISATINDINQELPAHCRIKKWRLMEQPLSIRDGELTPNLKLRRHILLKKFHAIIQNLYE